MTEELRQDDDLDKTDNIPIRRRKLFSARDLRATTIGWEIAIPIIGGPFFGFILDRRFDTGVRWTLILLGVGLIAAISAVLRYIRYEFYLMNKEKEEEEKQGIKKVWRNYDDDE
ncbi:MAG: AtpZ/AtpI family protein [Anaerolineaceae bacterium]|jgi:F0F1-type ATP synthase assembly protein I|nr:AtpZ/AtpI family protein [Anaerolineaceae bacterium]MDD4043635.1 AtpZ/AtpI family protein [Anaerolineaceae bacterium]MDD4577592.1 AtpZ/AtpI family protein [Anaerolineaceae bacterium]